MATRGTELTDTPINLVTALTPALETDQRYTLEASGETDVFVCEAASTPGDDAYWHILQRGTAATRLGLLVKDGVGVWARTPIRADDIARISFYGKCVITVTEAE